MSKISSPVFYTSAFIATAFARDNAEAAKAPVAKGRRSAPRHAPKARRLHGRGRRSRHHDLSQENHGQKIYSTNGLERLNGEIKRRTEVVGIFPHASSPMKKKMGSSLKGATDSRVKRYQVFARSYSSEGRRMYEPLRQPQQSYQNVSRETFWYIGKPKERKSGAENGGRRAYNATARAETGSSKF